MGSIWTLGKYSFVLKYSFVVGSQCRPPRLSGTGLTALLGHAQRRTKTREVVELLYPKICLWVLESTPASKAHMEGDRLPEGPACANAVLPTYVFFAL